jgi:hypothetical protein
LKVLAETSGNFCLYDLIGGQIVEAHRPCVVELTAFLNTHRGDRLTVLETLADDAEDGALALAKDEDELAAAIADLPRADKPAPKAAAPAKPKGK